MKGKAYVLKKIPLWLKITFALLLISLLGSIFAELSNYLIVPVFFISLIIFPGSKTKEPRLIRFIPWLWSLNGLISIAILVAGVFGKSIIPVGTNGPDGQTIRLPSTTELWVTILSTPLLLFAYSYTFWKKKLSPVKFMAMLVLSSLILIFLDLNSLLTETTNKNGWMDFFWHLVSEFILIGYIYSYLRSQKASTTTAIP